MHQKGNDSNPNPVASSGASNLFFAALAKSQSQPQQRSPQGKFWDKLQELRKLAKEGDISAWNKVLPDFETASRDAGICPKTHPRTQAEMKILELDLLLNAYKDARRKCEESAQDGEATAQLSKLQMMADWLEQQLLEKTKLESVD